jgi:Putative neutral zinc metallopeptidase
MPNSYQRQSQGYIVSDAFTHGSSAQRVRWFTTGPIVATRSRQRSDNHRRREQTARWEVRYL